MLNTLWSIFAFVVAIALLVTIHEYGHFIVARCMGVKVLRFSVGFGKALWSRRSKSGTEYVIAAIPLGGYVKMLDEREAPVAPEDVAFAFNRKSVYRRFAIIAAGPLFNFLFAIMAYWLMFVIGISSLAPIIGEVEPHSIAARSGLQKGDEILAVENKPTLTWANVKLGLLTFLGDDTRVNLTIKPSMIEQEETRWLLINNWALDHEDPRLLETLGIKPYFPSIPLNVSTLVPGSAAEKAGLEPGDKIIAIDGKPLHDWQELMAYVLPRPGASIKIELERNGELLSLPAVLGKTNNESGDRVGFLGIRAVPVKWPEDMLRTERYSVFASIVPAIEKTWHMSVLSLEMLGKMLTGQISPRNISGPVGIAQGAGYSARLGFSYFLNFLALISVSLAIINILPIPVLDGGHLFFCLLEWITRRPVPLKLQEIATQVGIFFLIVVMMFAVLNDLARL